MTIKIVRHGQTDLNYPIRRMQGISNYELNETGIKQAIETRKLIDNEDIDFIIVSPLKRAMQTANIINEFRKVKLIVDNRIIEKDYGTLEGTEFKSEYCNLDFDFSKYGGESIESCFQRLKEFLNDLKNNYSNKNVLIVTHNGIISILSCLIEGMPEDMNFEKRGIKTGQIKEFEI